MKTTLMKSVTGLQLIPRKQTFAEEDQKQNVAVNGPGSASAEIQKDIIKSPIKIIEQVGQSPT